MAKRLSELATNSLHFSARECRVRLDDSPEEVDQTYLTINGTPDGFRWLAAHLEGMAKSAEAHETGCSNIVAPRDFADKPVLTENWDSLEFACSKKKTE